MQNLRLISIWEANRNQNRQVNYHFHKYHQLVYYLKGSGKTDIGGTSFQFSEHYYAVIPHNTEHNEIHLSDSRVICLDFTGVENLPLGFYADPSHTIYNILQEVSDEVKTQKYGYEDMLTIKLNELLLHIFRNENNTVATKNYAYIINYLRTNYHEHIILTDCARQLNISYDYFQHKFKELTGCSPQQFLIDQRLHASLKLLEDGNQTCTDIAYRCGFCTSAQFSALFKKRYGLTPLQYKKSVRQKA